MAQHVRAEPEPLRETPEPPPHPSGGRVSVSRVLDRAARAERRRAVAWLIAGAVAAAATFAVGARVEAAVPALMGLGLALWSVRNLAGIRLARSDVERADTAPRRAHVVLLHDPNPKAVRPLLAIWPQPPQEGERLPKAESVWRCDDELDALKSGQGSVVVHEAWVDTGPRPRSKPRWVCADGGIALPHRRALLGRWYVAMLLRSERPGDFRRLTVENPHHVPQTGAQLPLGGSLLRSAAWRTVLLAAFTAIVVALA